MSRDETHQHKLTTTQKNCLKTALQEGRMIPEFYDATFAKIANNAPRDRLLIENFKTNVGTNILSLDQQKNILNKFLIGCLERSLNKGINQLMNMYNFTCEEIESMIPLDQFSTYDSFMIFGCPDSTGINLVVFVGECDYVNGQVKPLSSACTKRLHSDVESLGYNMSRDLDIMLIHVDPNTQTINASSKGTQETQNIIVSTWPYHRQIMSKFNPLIPLALELHPMVEIEITKDMILNKLFVIARYVLDHAQDIGPDNYAIFRNDKTTVCAEGGSNMLRFVETAITYATLNPADISDEHRMNWHNRFKMMTMKLIQLLLLFRKNQAIYTKYELPLALQSLLESNDDSHDTKFQKCAYWYLYCGTRGEYCSELFPYLIKSYLEIVEIFLSEDKSVTIHYDIDHIMKMFHEESHEESHDAEHEICISALTRDMLMEFLRSPRIHTESFERQWTEMHGSHTINSRFHIRSSDEDVFYETCTESHYSQDVLDVFKQCFLFMDQRSPEWLDCINGKFLCGANSANLKDTFAGKYNLIRGAIIEKIAMQLFDPSSIALHNFQKWSLGFIVERNEQDAHGFAPDLILLSHSTINSDQTEEIPEFILVEIKGLKSLDKNADYRRGLELASKQVRSGFDILSEQLSPDQLVIRRGVVILCCVNSEQFHMEIHTIDFD